MYIIPPRCGATRTLFTPPVCVPTTLCVFLLLVSATCPGALLSLTDGHEAFTACRLRLIAFDTNWTNGQRPRLWDLDNDASHEEGE